MGVCRGDIRSGKQECLGRNVGGIRECIEGHIGEEKGKWKLLSCIM